MTSFPDVVKEYLNPISKDPCWEEDNCPEQDVLLLLSVVTSKENVLVFLFPEGSLTVKLKL